MTRLDDDIVGLMMKRAYDVAGSTNKRCRVILNGKKLQINSFEDYAQLYLRSGGLDEGPAPCIYERCGERWEVAISLSDNAFSQVSHVNSICTTKGGTHVAHVADQLIEAILKVVKGKNRGGIEIKPQHVKNHLWIFVNCLIENPAFDSQTKETLTTKQSKFGSVCELSEKTMKAVLKSGVVEMILDWARAKQKVDIGRQLRGASKNQMRVSGIPKLEDANDAGGANSHECTLILTEGDSAKSLAVAGLSVVGRDRYGVFPLRGKVLNVRDANFKQVTGNAEIQNLLKIMGLDVKREYDSTRSLRYGSIMIMTDQDHDGSHIKGLLINLVHHWWPSLVKMNGFLKEFVTPIVKVWKDGKTDSERKDEKCFFTLSEYEKWLKGAQHAKSWKSKYYKGLGTSTAKEAKEYFKDIDKHEIAFRWTGPADGEAIDLAFNKKRANDRKDWINGYVDGVHVDHTQKHLTYCDFVNKELVQFAKYDTSRSVPSMVDGLKPGQRKVLFCSFKKKLKGDIKVAQFVGYISEHSAYHHGESSLENTIINMAQNFVGSNNINLLVPSGQFGTRLQGGKDHAASRYIYTRLSPATRHIFHIDDDKVLNYLEDEGQSIEPMWYCPILPTVLVNGADGIGTGWSTYVPNYNPREILQNIRRLLKGEAMQDMSPWYKGFRGNIVESAKEPGKFDMTGCIHKVSDTMLAITELPVKTWTQSYKEFLEELMPEEAKRGEDAAESTITDYREYHTENTVHFELTLTAEQMRRAEQNGLEKTFKLKTTIATSNMFLFNAEGKIKRYASALEILKEFCELRLRLYDERKGYLVAKLTREKEILSEKARFILMVVKGELELRKKKKADLLVELQRLGFKKMSELDAILQGKGAAEETTGAGGGDADEAAAEKSDYDYLLGMPLWSLTFEKVEELKKLRDLKIQELEELQGTPIEVLWERDLAALLACLDELEAAELEDDKAAAAATEGRKRKDAARRGGGGAARTVAPGAGRPRKAAEEPPLRAGVRSGGAAAAVPAAAGGGGGGGAGGFGGSAALSAILMQRPRPLFAASTSRRDVAEAVPSGGSVPGPGLGRPRGAAVRRAAVDDDEDDEVRAVDAEDDDDVPLMVAPPVGRTTALHPVMSRAAQAPPPAAQKPLAFPAQAVASQADVFFMDAAAEPSQKRKQGRPVMHPALSPSVQAAPAAAQKPLAFAAPAVASQADVSFMDVAAEPSQKRKQLRPKRVVVDDDEDTHTLDRWVVKVPFDQPSSSSSASQPSARGGTGESSSSRTQPSASGVLTSGTPSSGASVLASLLARSRAGVADAPLHFPLGGSSLASGGGEDFFSSIGQRSQPGAGPPAKRAKK